MDGEPRDEPQFESSEEMIREARQEIDTPVDEEALLTPTLPDDDEPEPHQAARPAPSPVRPDVRRPASQTQRARIILGIAIALLAMGIAIAAALLSSAH